MKISFLLLCFLFIFLNLNAQISIENKTEIDKIFQEWDKENSPGLALGIIQEGKLIYSRGYGIADLEHDIPLSSTSVFYMASVSKQFVTMCILLLEEQGKLKLDDEIQEYLPDFPKYNAPLTIRDFIHHTSGVRDNLTLWSLSGNTILDHIDDDAIYELIKKQNALNFNPGEKYLYSNSCYFMLAKIVQEVSGQSIKDFAEKHMFEPLGMKNTHFHDDVYHIVKNRAFSYSPSDESGYNNLIMRFDLVGSGGLYSNIEDMYLWDQNFYNNILGEGRSDLIAKMHEDGLLNNGESSNYAFGLVNGDYRGQATVGHGGALAGYRTHLLRLPDQKFSVVILANVSSFRAGQKAYQVADIMLSDVFEVRKEETTDESSPAPSQLSSEDLDFDISSIDQEAYTGTFHSEELNVDYILYLEEGKLMSQIRYNDPWILKPATKDQFKSDGVTFNFQRSDESGKSTISGFTLDAGRVKNIRFIKD